MTNFKLSNIPLKDVRKYLKLKGAKKKRTKGGHEMWFHKDLPRSITLQSHIDPVYEFILKQIVRYFGDDKESFHKILNNETKKDKKKPAKPTKRGKKSKKRN